MPRHAKPNPATVAERLTAARLKAGFRSQMEFAIVLGVSRGLVSQWEMGLKVPGRDNLTAVAARTAVSIDYLLGATNQIKQSLLITDAQEVKMMLAFRRLAPLGKSNLVEFLTVGIDIRRSVQQETEES